MTSRSTLLHGEVGDGREKALLEYVLKTAKASDPSSVLKAMDEYAEKTWMMNIGSGKGVILDNAVTNMSGSSPKLVLELGTYCGYSAVRIASLLDPGSMLVSLEVNPSNASIARAIIKHAGLESSVMILEGVLKSCIVELKRMVRLLGVQGIGMVFIDHRKSEYLPDLLLLKNSGLINKGSVIVADNMTIPGSPPYWNYLKSNPQEFKTTVHKCSLEYMSWLPDSVTVSEYLGAK